MADANALKALDAFLSEPNAQSQSTNAASNVSALDRFLSSVEQTPSPSPQTPKTDAALSVYRPGFHALNEEFRQAEQGFNQVVQPGEAYLRANQEPGVPLDITSGADVLTRLALGIHRNKQEQLRVLREMKGAENVRLDPSGNFIFRVKDEGGKPRDIKVDEANFTFKDFLDLIGEVPGFALSIATTKGVPVGSVLKGALAGAAGYAGGGILEDIAARGAANQAIDLPAILGERASEFGVNTVAGYGLGKAIQGLGTVPRILNTIQGTVSDMTKKGALGEAEAGRIATEARFGIPMEPTVGELTQNPFATRIEAFLSNIPFARNIVRRNWERQIANEKAIMNAMLGGEPPDPVSSGQQVIDILQSELRGLQKRSGKAADIVRRESTEALTRPLEALPGGPITAHEFGARQIFRGNVQLQSFKNEAANAFEEIKSTRPDALEPVFSTDPLKREADLVRREELVNRDKVTENVVFDQYGNPSTKETVSKTPIKPLIPTGVDPILSAIDELPAKQSYFDLIRLRNDIYDRLDSPEPISGRGTFLLKRLGRAVTEQLDQQGETVLEPATRSMIKRANKLYSENVETFYQKGVNEMLKPRTESGAINPELLASRLLAGGKGSVTTYQTLRDFFKSKGGVEDMNRLLRDHLTDSATDEKTGLLVLEDLVKSVSKLEPEIVQELYKQSKDKLLRSVREGQLGLKALTAREGGILGGRGEQAAVEAAEFKSLVEGGKLDSTALKKLVVSTAQLKAQWRTAARRAVNENDFGAIEAAPETFVKDYLANPAISLAEVKDVMQSVYRRGDPDVIGDVRRAYLGELLSGSAKHGQDVTQIVGQAKGSPLLELDPQMLSLKLKEPADRARAMEILGNDSFQALEDFAKGISTRSGRDMAGLSTGAFAGTEIGRKLLGGKLSALSEMPQYLALSYLLTSPRTVRFLRAAPKMSQANADQAIRLAVLSPEFFRVIVDEAASPQEAARMAGEIRTWGQQP